MSDQHIVIIGGTACGPKAAARAGRCDPSAKITIVEQGVNLSTATCGLPYYISGVIESEDEMVVVHPDYFEDTLGMKVHINTRAIAIDRKAHTITLSNLKTKRESSIEYDKLVLSTGSNPAVPNLEGRDLQGVFTLTGLEDANTIRSYLSKMTTKEVVIVGAGLIGLEMAEAFVTSGLKVTVIEALDWPLPTLLDFDIAAHIEKHMRHKGIEFIFGHRVGGFKGDKNGRLCKVIAGDREIDAGLALLSLGVRPDTSLARDAGLTIGPNGGIAVNEYLQTSDPDIYAGGDCVEIANLVTGQSMLAPMGSTANKHGRIIGTNVTGGREKFPGVLGTAIVKLFDHNAGRTGLSELQAEQAGYETVMSLVPSNEHATYYPGSREFLLKLVADKATGRVLGAQMVGPGDIAKRIDVLATAISCGATVDSLANLDLAYAPPYNSSMDPVHNAANVIRNKQAGLARGITAEEVKKKLDNGEDFTLLDVRNQDEWDAVRIETGQAKLMPLPALRLMYDDLKNDGEIVAVCKTSIRAYQAQRILDDAGFTNVKFMDGSLDAWPFDVYSGDTT